MELPAPRRHSVRARHHRPERGLLALRHRQPRPREACPARRDPSRMNPTRAWGQRGFGALAVDAQRGVAIWPGSDHHRGLHRGQGPRLRRRVPSAMTSPAPGTGKLSVGLDWTRPHRRPNRTRSRIPSPDHARRIEQRHRGAGVPVDHLDQDLRPRRLPDNRRQEPRRSRVMGRRTRLQTRLPPHRPLGSWPHDDRTPPMTGGNRR